MTQKQPSTICQAAASDISAIASLERDYYGGEGFPAGFLYQSLAQWPQGLWVAKQNQQVIGYTLAVPAQTANEYWLMAVLLAKQARGLGLGQALCEQVITTCAELGASKLWLSVAPANHSAVALYRKLGFVEAGQRADFLGPGEHRLLMQRALG